MARPRGGLNVVHAVPCKTKILVSARASVIPARTGLNIIAMSKKHLAILFARNSAQFPRLSTQRVEAVVYSSVQTPTYVSALSLTTATVYAYLSRYRLRGRIKRARRPYLPRRSSKSSCSPRGSGPGGPVSWRGTRYTRERVEVA